MDLRTLRLTALAGLPLIAGLALAFVVSHASAHDAVECIGGLVEAIVKIADAVA